MKKIILLILLSSQCLAQNGIVNNTTPVGSIVTSVLTWKDFKNLNPQLSENYLPCDGRPVPTDAEYYHPEKRTHTPDLRGVFLRGANRTTTDKNDFQTQHPVQAPWKNVENTELGKHQKQDWNTFKVVGEEIDTVGNGASHNWRTVPKQGDMDGTDRVFSGHWSSQPGTALNFEWYHNDEVRPDNISVSYFIKIN